MSAQQAFIEIGASREDICDVLLDVARIPEWNQACLDIGGVTLARVGEHYPIRVRAGLSGHFQYDVITAERIESSWRVPGFRERNSWQLRPQGDARTVVTHALTQTGPLAALLANDSAAVAELRLGRLRSRVEERANVRE